MSDLYFNEKSDYSEDNASSTVLQPFQVEPKQKKMSGYKSHENEIKHILASAANLLLHIRIGNIDGANADRTSLPLL